MHIQQFVGPGDTVDLFIDPTQDEIDRYGRLLRYVITSDDLDLGEAQITTGNASVYVYNHNPFVSVDAYQQAEDAARLADTGLWGAC